MRDGFKDPTAMTSGRDNPQNNLWALTKDCLNIKVSDWIFDSAFPSPLLSVSSPRTVKTDYFLASWKLKCPFRSDPSLRQVDTIKPI